MTHIFPPANELRSDGRSYLIIFNEIRAIENSILFASDSGILDCQVYNTYMSSTVLNEFQDITNVDTSTNIFTKNSHNLKTGDEIQLSTSGTLPAPLDITQTYYAIVIDINTFKLSSNFLNCINNIPIDILTTGTGTHSFRIPTPSELYFKTWQGSRNDRSQVNQMNAVIQHFTGLGYGIKRQSNPNVPGVFQWVLSW